MDTIDQAGQLEQLARDAGIASACAAAAALQVPSGRTHCQGCHKAIPLLRLRLVPAARHCTDCAARTGES